MWFSMGWGNHNLHLHEALGVCEGEGKVEVPLRLGAVVVENKQCPPKVKRLARGAYFRIQGLGSRIHRRFQTQTAPPSRRRLRDPRSANFWPD